MKQLLYIFCAALFFTACKKDTVKVFEETPEERMSARINELNTTLTGAEHGWKAFLTTSAGGAYGFYMDFDPSQSLLMVADLTDESASKASQSTYRIKWVMNATLIFDTYNYLSMLQDPVPSVYGGAPGTGLKSDVEFEYQRMNGDTVFLRGFKYKNELTLVKVNSEQKNRYLGTAFKANIDEITNFFIANQNNYINLKGTANNIEFLIDRNSKYATLQYVNDNGTAAVQINTKYSYEDQGITFDSGFVLFGITFTKGRIENGQFVLIAADGTKYLLKQAPAPFIPMTLLFAYNFTYKELYIGTGLPAGVTSGFNTAYQASVTKFAAMAPTRTLVDVRFILTNSSTATVTIRNNNGTTTFTANATFKYTYVNDIITLSNPIYDGNWTPRVTQLIDIQNWFNSGPFRVDYVKSSNPNVVRLGGLYRVADNTSFFYGSLRK